MASRDHDSFAVPIRTPRIADGRVVEWWSCSSAVVKRMDGLRQEKMDGKGINNNDNNKCDQTHAQVSSRHHPPSSRLPFISAALPEMPCLASRGLFPGQDGPSGPQPILQTSNKRHCVGADGCQVGRESYHLWV